MEYLILPVIVIMVSELFLRHRDNHATRNCRNPSCARCANILSRSVLNDHLNSFIKYNPAISINELNRVKDLVASSDRCEVIIKSVYARSGYRCTCGVVNCTCTCARNLLTPCACGHSDVLMHHVIWTLPELSPRAIWPLNHPKLTNLYNMAQILLPELQNEYLQVRNTTIWSTNRTPKGLWRVLPLCNQGIIDDANVALCPVASKLITSIADFLGKNIYCYAMYSELHPGSVIEPHTGPCNYRLRCHIPLHVPPGYWLKVGNTAVTWETNTVLVFDDSFVHTVWYKREDNTDDYNKERVIFIIDIWHPEVTDIERLALNYIFKPK